MSRFTFWAIVAVLVIGGTYVLFLKERPYALTRFTAARAIESTAQFQHKTKLFFEINQAESFLPSVCDNFEFAPEKKAIFTGYLNTGEMKFGPYRNQRPPFRPASAGSLDLSVGGNNFLVNRIESCRPREVTKTTGAYELSLGTAIIQITGIRKNGTKAVVDFIWHFESINEVGQALPYVQGTKQMEMLDSHYSPEEREIAPFWTGSAELTKYDDGWRVVTVDLSSSGLLRRWEYGPEHWPDPNFDWGTFDENENRF